MQILERLAPAELVIAEGIFDEFTELIDDALAPMNTTVMQIVTVRARRRGGPLAARAPWRDFPDGLLLALVRPTCMSPLLWLLCRRTRLSHFEHINRLSRWRAQGHLLLDATCRRNLELTANQRDGGRTNTVLSAIDRYASAGVGVPCRVGSRGPWRRRR